MNSFAKEIMLVNIEEELQNSYLDYAMSVIVGRALPDVRDGLKPVHRRVLYAMNVLGNNWDKGYKKSARIVGDVIGKYHPHGDTAVYDAIVRMAQPFSLRYMLVDGQGNFGSIDGDSAAAMRYTEVRLAKIAHELMADLEKETVDFIENYDGTEKIPDVMPTKIPNLLVNGSSGIAVGMATNIPPHNIGEVISGCLAYIDNENISIEELMKYIPGPDFPTAAIINGINGIKEAYSTGRGKIYIRARAKVKTDVKTGRETIFIYEIPYQVNKARLIEKIAELVKEKSIDGISALRDESDKDGMRIVIEIKRGSVAEVVLNHLYCQTQLQISFGINMVALFHGQPNLMNLKKIIEAFISHRTEVITRRTNFELNKMRNRIHTIEALVVAIANIDQITNLVRFASTPKEAKATLISHSWDISNITTLILKRLNNKSTCSEWIESKFNTYSAKYHLNEQQAQDILNLRLQKITALEHEKLLDEYSELLEHTSQLMHVLSDKNRLREVIRDELKLIRKEFQDPRRSEIMTTNTYINTEDLVSQKQVIVTISYQGYVKYQSLTDYVAQRRGGKGKSAVRIKETDFINRLLVVNTHDTILCFSTLGRLYWMKVYQLQEASRGARGRPLANLLPIRINERITAILPVHKYGKDVNVFMVTAKGIVKKTALTDFSHPRTAGIVATNLNKGDELIGVDLTYGSDDVMLFSAAGKVVRFKEETVRTMGRSATGVYGIKLANEDKVVSLIIPRGKGAILTVTQNGYGKRTLEEEYPIKSRGTQGVISIRVNERNGLVIGAVQVDESDQIMMITNVGTLVRTSVSEVRMIGRNTQGVILIRTAEGENVVSLQRVTLKQ